MSGTWVKLDDTFPDHPKVLAVGDEAAWLYVAGLCHCSRHLSDGFIAAAVLRRLTGQRNPEALAERLVAERLWEPAEGGWQVHGYSEHQRTREQVEHDREKARERAQRSRELRAKSRRDAARTSGEVTEPVECSEVTDNPPSPPADEFAVTADVYRMNEETQRRGAEAARLLREERFRAGSVVPIATTAGAARALGGNQ
jgi:hypothetical protein